MCSAAVLPAFLRVWHRGSSDEPSARTSEAVCSTRERLVSKLAARSRTPTGPGTGADGSHSYAEVTHNNSATRPPPRQTHGGGPSRGHVAPSPAATRAVPAGTPRAMASAGGSRLSPPPPPSPPRRPRDRARDAAVVGAVSLPLPEYLAAASSGTSPAHVPATLPSASTSPAVSPANGPASDATVAERKSPRRLRGLRDSVDSTDLQALWNADSDELDGVYGCTVATPDASVSADAASEAYDVSIATADSGDADITSETPSAVWEASTGSVGEPWSSEHNVAGSDGYYGAALGDGWELVYTDDGQHPFYFNVVTGMSQWEEPLWRMNGDDASGALAACEGHDGAESVTTTAHDGAGSISGSTRHVQVPRVSPGSPALDESADLDLSAFHECMSGSPGQLPTPVRHAVATDSPLYSEGVSSSGPFSVFLRASRSDGGGDGADAAHGSLPASPLFAGAGAGASSTPPSDVVVDSPPRVRGDRAATFTSGGISDGSSPLPGTVVGGVGASERQTGVAQASSAMMDGAAGATAAAAGGPTGIALVPTSRRAAVDVHAAAGSSLGGSPRDGLHVGVALGRGASPAASGWGHLPVSRSPRPPQGHAVPTRRSSDACSPSTPPPLPLPPPPPQVTTSPAVPRRGRDDDPPGSASKQLSRDLDRVRGSPGGAGARVGAASEPAVVAARRVCWSEFATVVDNNDGEGVVAEQAIPTDWTRDRVTVRCVRRLTAEEKAVVHATRPDLAPVERAVDTAAARAADAADGVALSGGLSGSSWERGHSVFQLAADGRLASVQALVSAGCPVDAREPHSGATALMLACENGHLAVVDALLRAGADPMLSVAVPAVAREDARRRGAVNSEASASSSGRDSAARPQRRVHTTPLHVAATMVDVNMLCLLCAHGADVSVPDCEGRSPLHAACALGHTRVAQWLVKTAAVPVVSAQDKLGRTPLHYAAACGHIDCTAFLLERGADASLLDESGCTAEALAARNGHGRTVGVIRARAVAWRAATEQIEGRHCVA